MSLINNSIPVRNSCFPYYSPKSKSSWENLFDKPIVLKITFIASLILFVPTTAAAEAQDIPQTIFKNSLMKDLCFANSAMSPFEKEGFDECLSFKDSSEVTNAFMLAPQISHYNQLANPADQEFADLLENILTERPQLSESLEKCTQYGLNLFRTSKEFHQNSYVDRLQKMYFFAKKLESNATLRQSSREIYESFVNRFSLNCHSEKIGNGLVVTAMSDHNGALKYLTAVESTLLQLYNVFGGIISDKNEICELLKNANILSGSRMDFLLIKGHGDPFSIQLGETWKDWLTTWGAEKIANCIKENLNEDAPIILSSCSTGFKPHSSILNIAETLSKETQRRVMAPGKEVRPSDCNVDVNIRDRSISSYSCLPFIKQHTHCYEDYESFKKREEFGKIFHLKPEKDDEKTIPNVFLDASCLFDRIKAIISKYLISPFF